jgi:hypothetical protein
MKRFKQLYELVEYVEATNKKRRQAKPQDESSLITGQELVEGFARSKHITEDEAHELAKTAYERKYIQSIQITFQDGRDRLYVTPLQGRDFLQKWLIFRVGMWNEVFSGFPVVGAFIGGVLSTGVLVSIAHISAPYAKKVVSLLLAMRLHF